MVLGKLGHTFVNLMLALLNATLILVALCLWLAWGALATVDRISDKVTSAIAETVPLRTEVQGVRAELVGLREDLALLRTSDRLDVSRSGEIASEISALRSDVDRLTTAIEGLDANADSLIQQAIETTFSELNTRIGGAVPFLTRAGRSDGANLISGE